MAKPQNNNTKSAWVIFGVVVAAIIIVLGVLAFVQYSKPAKITVTDSQPSIQVAPGQEFTINLNSNPTTGYSWSLDDTYNKNVVSKIGYEFQTSNSNLSGAPGTDLWMFKGGSAGSTQLVFRYIHPWEGNSSQVDSKTFNVTVK